MPVYEIRDPVHRTILVSEAERLVLDHPWIQRLRHIRQLGLVSLVYPGAVHDRFQHSLGVMHLAGSCFDRLVEGSPVLREHYAEADLAYARHLLRLAGLLHDAGHAPFSHTSEAWFPPCTALALPDDWYRGRPDDQSRQATHEDMTLALIQALATDRVMAEDEARDVAAVLSPGIRSGSRLAALGPLAGLLRALVSGEMDADRCDYLLRDSHYTGVSYGVYDLQRLMACMQVIDGEEGPELGLDVHGVFALEGLLLARYHMFHQVYFHKTPPAFEYYLDQAIASGEIVCDLSRGLEDLVQLRDDSIWNRLHAARADGGQWSHRILDREPAKLVLRERMGLEQQENFLAQGLIEALQEAGCRVFTRRSRQRFTAIAGAGAVRDGTRLLCERRILGRPIVESVTLHSDLLAAFNRPIDLRYTYVLAGDAARARDIIDRFPVW